MMQLAYLHEPCQGRDIARALPEYRCEQRLKQRHVWGWKIIGGMELNELSKDLKYIGMEFLQALSMKLRLSALPQPT